MSSALAIASVTAVLRDLLNNGLIDHNVPGAVGDVTVTALPPDRIELTANNFTSRLNLYLYKVSYNPGWRNVGLPTRGADGERTGNQPLALDLHYLLTAYGNEELHSEILLGYGMQILHETPVLTRDAVRTALQPPTPGTNLGGLPPQLQALFTSELAEQVELIKIAPETMTAEELFNTWSAFSTTYRPSAMYQASVVLIQSRRPFKAALPVRARNLYVVPFKQPVVERVRSRAAPGDPVLDQPIFANHLLVVEGHNLRGEGTLLKVGDTEVTPAPADIGDTQVVAPLPAGLGAGVHGVQVVHRILMGSPPAPHKGVESNVAPFVLRPRVVAPVAATKVLVTGPALRSADVTVTLEPAVGATQRVVLLLNELQAPASPLDAPAAPASSYGFVSPPRLNLQSPPASPPGASVSVTFGVSGVRPGRYLVRVQVDGAESPLDVGPDGRFQSPQVEIA
jgi:hypothetical protein